MSVPDGQNLSRDPVTDPRQVWLALAQAAEALKAAASAMLGESSPVLSVLPSLPHTHSRPDGCTVLELVNQFLLAKARAGRSDRYLRALRVSLLAFARGRKQWPAGEVTVDQVEAWLNRSGWAARTRRGYLADVRTMYRWGIRRNLVARNPAAAVELPQEERRPPAIHTPEQVGQVLEFARGYDVNICRALAVRYFAGLRSAEVDRFEEHLILGSYIEVPARNAKTRQRRLVDIQPALRAWLALGGKLPLHDLSNRWRWFTAELKENTGITWPGNVTRHSFVSYHLARWQSAAKTALQAGHSEAMVFRHYREVVTKEAALAFWSILPKKKV